MTFIQAINQVLVRLRETQVAASNTSAYASLIGAYVNDAMEETQKSWHWTALRTTLPITTANGTSEYAITGTNPSTQIRFAYNDTNNNYVFQQSWDYIQRSYATAAVTPSGPPSYFAPIGFDTAGLLKVKFFGEPDSIETINMYCVVPQTAFEVDGTEDSSVLSTPTLPIILGAYARAVEERGEDGGTTAARVYDMYNKAWGDAIAIDASLTMGETEWQVD